MADPSPFPRYEPPPPGTFLRQQVVDHLLRVSALGYGVYSDGHDFVFPQEDGEIRVKPRGPHWQISRTRLRVLQTLGDAATAYELDELLRQAFGHNRPWPEAPQAGRFVAAAPASNYRTISSLIGSGEVLAVFDAYLDNQGLEHLIRILSFGDARVAPNVRLLGTTATLSMSPGRPSRFTAAGVAAWAAQLGVIGEARCLPQAGEHRRFMLLDGGRSLILGPSLNSLHKNEAVHVEADVEDHPFFEAKWSSATALP